MADKSFFIDTTRCTACRGCQVACKQWNKNPETKTRNRGTYQNPADLSAATFKLVRFREAEGAGGEPKWLFFQDQCRHCIDPLCKLVADGKSKGAVVHDKKTGAVVYDPTVKIALDDFREVRQICPFDIPRYDEKLGGMAKCTMCIDRVDAGMRPACVQACPTGTMNFGDRAAILKMADERLQEVRKTHKAASLADRDSVRVIFLLTDPPEKYYLFAAERHATGISRKMALRRLGRPAAYLRGLIG